MPLGVVLGHRAHDLDVRQTVARPDLGDEVDVAAELEDSVEVPVDDRLLLLAKGIGLVAEVEGIKASALFVYHTHESSAKMLADYPGRQDL